MPSKGRQGSTVNHQPVKNSSLRLPPQNIEAEQSVLGAMLLDRDAVVSVAEFLKPEHFYRQEQHGVIYQAILTLFDLREPIDLVTVAAQLKKNGTYDQAGGTNYLSTLVNAVPTAAHVEHYGRLVLEQAIRRQLIASTTNIAQTAYDSSIDTKELLDLAESNIFSISQHHTRGDFIPIKDALAESFDRLDELHKKSGSLRGVPSGFRDLDSKLAGMQNSNLIILASRPGMGKTSLALNIAQHVAVDQQIPVGIFSLEMSCEELVDRMLVAQGDVDAWRLKTGKLEEDDFERLSVAMGELAEAPLFIDDTPGASIMEMRTKARRLQVEKGLRLLIVDYLQLARGRNLENRVQEVSEISQSLKNLARELKIPVLALSQLSRAVESRGSRKPQLADLRESGAIEQDADVVMFLWREDPDQLELVKLSIEKHRNGPMGEIDLYFRGDRVHFFGMEHKRQAAKQPSSAHAAAKAA